MLLEAMHPRLEYLKVSNCSEFYRAMTELCAVFEAQGTLVFIAKGQPARLELDSRGIMMVLIFDAPIPFAHLRSLRSNKSFRSRREKFNFLFGRTLALEFLRSTR